jgi:hypothetical protein
MIREKVEVDPRAGEKARRIREGILKGETKR